MTKLDKLIKIIKIKRALSEKVDIYFLDCEDGRYKATYNYGDGTQKIVYFLTEEKAMKGITDDTITIIDDIEVI